MARITFIYPDYESLGVEYLMAACIEQGHSVNFVYYQAEDLFLGKKSKKIDFREIAEKITKTKPDIVAFSAVTDNYRYQFACAKAVKGAIPKAIVIFGGIHPTAVPEKVLRNPQIDCVAIGESEKSFISFLKKCDRKGEFALPGTPVDGIVFKKSGKIVGKFKEGPLCELDSLPYPYKKPIFSSLKDASYEYRIITSRGCPYNCTYCFNAYFRNLRKPYCIRQRSVDNVMNELLWVKKQYPLKYVLFIDDSFTTNKKWILEFCRRYEKEIALPFACISNPFYMNKQIIDALKSAGCVNVQIGIQSLSEELCRDILKRASSNSKIVETIRELKDAGIMVQVDHMLGIPGDTVSLQEKSLLLYNRMRPNLISIFWLTYYPKTAILETAKQHGFLTDGDLEMIEEGLKPAKNSYLSGGSMKDPKPFLAIAFMYNYLPIMPRWLVTFLVKTRLYRIFRTNNYYVTTVFPRFVQSIFNKKDFRGRSHIIRFLDKTFISRFKAKAPATGM